MLTITFCLEDGPKRYSKFFFLYNLFYTNKHKLFKSIHAIFNLNKTMNLQPLAER